MLAVPVCPQEEKPQEEGQPEAGALSPLLLFFADLIELADRMRVTEWGGTECSARGGMLRLDLFLSRFCVRFLMHQGWLQNTNRVCTLHTVHVQRELH